MADKTLVLSLEDNEHFCVNYPMGLFIYNASGLSEICTVKEDHVECKTREQEAMLRAFVQEYEICERVIQAAASVLGEEAVDEVLEEATDITILARNVVVISRLCDKMRDTKEFSGGAMESLMRRAAEGYLEEIHDAFQRSDLDRLMRKLSLATCQIETVRSFLLRSAIYRLTTLVLEALSANAEDKYNSEHVKYMNEEEKEVIDLIKKELTGRARGILVEDFDEATKGE